MTDAKKKTWEETETGYKAREIEIVLKERLRSFSDYWGTFDIYCVPRAPGKPISIKIKYLTGESQNLSESLVELAKNVAANEGIGFSAALQQVAQKFPDLVEARQQEQNAHHEKNDRLTQLAEARAREKSISFSAALTEIAAERPDLITP